MTEPKKDLDKSIAEKRAYDFLIRAEEGKQWMESMIGEKIPGSTADLMTTLRDGISLCHLANVFTNGSIKNIKNQKTLEFMATENLNSFFKACKSIDFPDYNFFTVPDIWEKKNITKVVACIHALAHYINKKFPKKYVTIKDLSKKGLKFQDDEIQKIEADLKKATGPTVTIKPPQLEEPDTDDTGGDDTDDLELADPDECTVEGDAIQKSYCGQENSFFIVSKDNIGNALDHGGEKFKAVMFRKATGQQQSSGNLQKTKVVATVTDLENGKYKVTYVPNYEGEYNMDIYLVDEDEELELKCCPINIFCVGSKKSNPTNCQLDGAGSSFATAGAETKFLIKSFDAFGNTGLGGENFTCRLSCGDSIVDGTVKDLQDGSYEVTYTCPKSGVYTAAIRLGDAEIAPGHQVTVKDSGVSDAQQCKVLPLAKQSYTAGEHVDIGIAAKDKLGNQRESGGEKFICILHNKTLNESKEVEMSDNQNGTYSYNQPINSAGQYEVRFQLNGKDVPETVNFMVNDLGTTDPSRCTTSCKADSLSALKAGTEVKIFMESRDSLGNLRGTGGDVYSIQIVNKEKKDVLDAQIQDMKNGTYEVSFVLKETGDYILDGTVVTSSAEDQTSHVGGLPIDNIHVVESGVSEAATTQYKGDGIHDAQSKKPAQFFVLTCDPYGNRRTTGGDEVKVRLFNKEKGFEIVPEVGDNGDGTYEVTYTPEIPIDATFDAEVLVNGVDACKSNPQHIKIKGLSLKSIDENQLLQIQDHDLLASLLNLFKEEEQESMIGKIQEIREQLVGQIRKNFELENAIKQIEKNLELMIENRNKYESELAQQKASLFSRKKKQQAKGLDDKAIQAKNIDHYSHLFYLLQTQPKYLSKCLFIVPPENVDKFLETVILTLYGYAFSPREEYLMLNLFKQTLQMEVERDTKKCGSFLEGNPVLPKMVITYGRRLQGKQFLQKVLYDKIIEPILKIKDLDLELNAVKILKAYASDKEVETGQKMDIDFKNINYAAAMKDAYTSQKVNDNIKKLCDICASFLQGMIDNVTEIPYGLKYVCKELDKMLKIKHPDSSETDRATVVGFFAYFRFMNPAVVSPDGFELTKKPVSPLMRNNLILISKVMTNLVNNNFFDKKLEEHMVVMNDWLKSMNPKYLEFIRKLVQVADPEESLGVDEYMELTQKSNPSITIKWSEIYSTHKLLLTYIHKLAPDKEDPLNIILESESMKTVPEDQSEDEIKLPLVNGFVEKTTSDKPTPEQVYDKTKENFRTLLKNLPPDSIQDSVEETIQMAKKFTTDGSDKSKVLASCVQQIEEALPILLEASKIQKKSKYRELIIDITKEIQNTKAILQKQKREFERLKESLAALVSHQKYLEEKVSDFQQFNSQSTTSEFAPSTKKFNFTFEQLEKKGVIKEISVTKTQRKAVKFTISMPHPGTFLVDAKVAGLVVKSIEIKVEDLLNKKAKGIDKLDFDYVVLDVNMTLHVVNKLFVSTKK